MKLFNVSLFVVMLSIAGCVTARAKITPVVAQAQVLATERAFAKTMADRDHPAFTTFLADEVIFFGDKEPLRGKAFVAAGWKPFFDGAKAPFSWEPSRVEVLDSATLALSTGRVHDATGNCIAIFNSIWRREASGDWRIVFDKGSRGCDD